RKETEAGLGFRLSSSKRARTRTADPWATFRQAVESFLLRGLNQPQRTPPYVSHKCEPRSMGPRGQDLSKSTVARLAIGGLFVGSLLIVSAISYDNTISPRGIVIHHSWLCRPSFSWDPTPRTRCLRTLTPGINSTGYVGSASSIGDASTILATT